MGKIFKFDELNKKKGEHLVYFESYNVDFTKKDGEFWKECTDVYFAKTAGEHKEVERRWKNDNKRNKVKLKRITYN